MNSCHNYSHSALCKFATYMYLASKKYLFCLISLCNENVLIVISQFSAMSYSVIFIQHTAYTWANKCKRQDLLNLEQTWGAYISCLLQHVIDRRWYDHTIGRVSRWLFDLSSFHASATWEFVGNIKALG